MYAGWYGDSMEAVCKKYIHFCETTEGLAPGKSF